MSDDRTIKPSELNDIRKRLAELMALSTASIISIEGGFGRAGEATNVWIQHI